jgi:hypothetical protein
MNVKANCYVKIVSDDFPTVARLIESVSDATGFRAERMKRMGDEYVTFLLPEDRVGYPTK